jgi:phytol kinase
MIGNNYIALVITLGLAVAWLRINDFAAQRGWISSALSRKIIHTGTGPIFVLCWLLFNNDPAARYLASLIPLLITAQFALVGSGIIKDEGAVKAMSRSGDRKEILRGPLFYGIAFVLLTIVFWRDNVIGIVALMVLCGGDGLADVIGKRVPSEKIPWSRRKSWAGTVGMFAGSWVFAALVLAAYSAAGVFARPLAGYLPGITVISLAATAVETLPYADIDNITVTLTAVILGYVFFIG